jgi:hypothetical protein
MIEERKPYIHVLNFSGGAQSSYMLELVLRGEIEKPRRFLVVNADPGMEGRITEKNMRSYRARCAEAGIDMITAPGPNLYNDLVSSPFTGSRRLDNPPFWTKDENGKRGRLMQKCTQFYKIAPMDRTVRKWMQQRHAITTGMLRPNLVERWIGFTSDEWHRCSEPDVAYAKFRYPLIEMEISKSDVVAGFEKWGMKCPKRSVCSACPFNGLDHYERMYRDEPDSWEQAVEVDDSVEKWKELGITECEVFVSSSLIRLRDMPAMNFGKEREDLSEHHCNSGVCFL